MPTVQRYRRSQGIGGLDPARHGVNFDNSGLRAAVASSVPDKNDVPLIAAGADFAAGKRGVALQKAGAEYAKFVGGASAQVQAAAGRAEAKAQQMTDAILAASSARFLKLQEDIDASEVMKATNEWHRFANEYWNDPQKGVAASRQLAGAQGCYKDTQDYLKELTSRVSGGLATNAQRMAFLKSVSGAALAMEERASRWEASEINKNLKLTAEATVSNAIESVVSDPSAANFDAQLGRIFDVIDYQMRGAAPELIDEAHKEYRSRLHTAIVESVIERDPKKAEAYFDAVSGEVSADIRPKLEKRVRDAALVVKSQEELPALFEKYGYKNLAGAVKEIRDNFSGKEEEFRVNAAESFWREQTRARNEREDNEFDRIIGMTDKKVPFSQVIAAVNDFDWSSNAMRVKVKEYVEREYQVGEFAPRVRFSGGGGTSGGGIRGADISLLAALDKAREDGSLFDKCPTFQEFVERFGGALAKMDLREYRKYYQKFNKGNVFEAKLDVKFGKVFDDLLAQAGVKSGADREVYKHNFNKYADFKRAKFKKEGRPFTDKDYFELMNEFMEPVVVGQKKTWYGRTYDITKRRGDLPANARQGINGKWYSRGEDGVTRPVVFKE